MRFSWILLVGFCPAAGIELEVSQVTSGPKNHFFGYIGHVKNIPWNGEGRYIVALRTDFQDRMPSAGDAADVVLIDAQRGNSVEVIDRTRAWNFQQGTMFYWNPKSPDTEIFFNDRDPKTNHVFTVLYDIKKRGRVREYRFADTPFGNSGVAQNGGRFLGISYGRLARLRPVTGYPESFDWTAGIPAPENDGIFLVDVSSGRKRLLVSFRQLAMLVKPRDPEIDGKHLFINHTLWSRDDQWIYFYVRANFEARGGRVDIPCVIRPDGSGLAMLSRHIGGHPEWESGSRMIGSADGRQIIYDVERQEIVDTLARRDIIPDPGADVALSPDGLWLVNGYRVNESNYYVVYRRSDGAHARTQGFPHPGRTKGELRVDGSPNWNRTNDQVLFPAIAPDGTRQLFLMRIR